MHNILDYLVICIAVFSVVMGLAKGTIREALSLSAWIIAGFISIYFSNPLAVTLEKKVPTETLRLLIAFAFLLIITLCISTIINNFLARIPKIKIVFFYDALMSFILSSIKSFVIITLVILMISLTPLNHFDLWKESFWASTFSKISNKILNLTSKELLEKSK